MNEAKTDTHRGFLVDSILAVDRIDCSFYDPEYFKTMEELTRLSKSNAFDLLPLSQLLDDSDARNLTGGATPLGATYPLQGIPFIRSQNIKETGIDRENTVFIARALHEKEFRRSQIKPRDVLLTITGAIFGISAVAPQDIAPANINQHIVRIAIDHGQIMPEYLCMFLNSKYGRKQMDRASTGGTRQALDYGSIRNLQILRPEMETQTQVVKEVNRLYAEAKELRETVSKLEQSYDSIVLSKLGITVPEEPRLKTFLASLGNDDRMEVKWHYPYYEQVIRLISKSRSRKIGALQHELKYGASIDADYVGNMPFLRIENLRRNHIDLSDIQYISSGVHKSEVASLHLQEGDILLERSGTYVGLAAYIPKGMEDHVYGSYIIRLRLPDEEQVLRRYLCAYLNSILGRIQFDKVKTGSLQFNINLQQIRDVIIIEPPKPIQQDIASETFHLIDQVNDLRGKYEEKLRAAKSRFVELLEAH